MPKTPELWTMQDIVNAVTIKNKKEEKDEFEPITAKVRRLIESTISDVGDDDGWAFLGDVGSLLQKKQPNFDARNYGFQKLTPLIKSIKSIETDERESGRSRSRLIYVRVK